MIDPMPLWSFDDPAGSEARFRDAAGSADGAGRAVLLTQIARALGLQDRYAEGHAVLDGLTHDVADASAEIGARIALERGRLLRSAGDPAAARPLFHSAASLAEGGGLDALHVDALHMLALVAEANDQERLTRLALSVAIASADSAARDWDASLLNNLGMVHADAGDFAHALPVFEDALAACRRIDDPGRIRIARWMVGWALRNLGRVDAARVVQHDLKRELEAARLEDPHVDEELALLDPI